SVFEAVELDRALPDPDRAQAADPARIAEQFALDAKPLLAVLVDDEPRPTVAEPRIYIFVPQAERLEDVAVGVHDVVGAGHRDILRMERTRVMLPKTSWPHYPESPSDIQQ